MLYLRMAQNPLVPAPNTASPETAKLVVNIGELESPMLQSALGLVAENAVR
jgi:hypothetical protein